MSEKYFILCFMVGLLGLIAAILGLIILYLRYKHLRKLAQLNILRRQQLFSGNALFSTYVVNKVIAKLFFSFKSGARKALRNMVGGRPEKAVEHLKAKNFQLSLLLKAHYADLRPIFNKLKRLPKKQKSPLVYLGCAQIAHLLFEDFQILPLLNRVKFKKLPQTLKACYLYLSSFSYLQEGDMLSASKNSSQALKIFKKQHYFAETAKTYLLLAETYRICCVNDVAQTMIEAALKIYNSLKLSFFSAQTTTMLGMLMMFENRLEEAEEKFEFALQSSPQKQLDADIFNQFALLKLAQKEEQSALKYAQKAFKLHRCLNNERGEAFSQQLIGHFKLNADAPEKAVSAANSAAKLYFKQQNFSAYAEAMYLQARALCKLQKFSQAEKILRTILAESQKESLNFHIANVYSLLGLIYLHFHNLKRAKVLFQQSLHLEQNHERCAGLALDYTNLALIESLSGNSDTADENLKLALEYAQKTENAELIALIKNKDFSQ